jgi:hypothetical protein
MKKLLIALLTLSSVSAFSSVNELSITLSVTGGKSKAAKIKLPRLEPAIVSLGKAKCIVDTSMYNAESEFGYLAMNITDAKGNEAYTDGYVENGSAQKQLSLNNLICVVQKI